MNIHSISFKILGVFFSTFILTAIIVILLAQIQLTATINSSQKAIYEEKINTILNILIQKEERLDATNLRNAYIDAFQESTLEIIENTYYNSSDILNKPFIIDGNRHFLISPFPPGSDIMTSLNAQKLQEMKNSEFDFVTAGDEEQWCIFRAFPNWDWTVGYVIPHKEKYSDSRKLRNMLILSMIIIVLMVLTLLSIIIKRMIKPVLILTGVSKAMAEGDLNQNINISGKDEIGSLARNFASMGEVVREKIAEQELRIVRTNRLRESVSNLAVSELRSSCDFSEIAKEITESVVHTLDIGRASIWFFNDDHSRINCVDLYEKSTVHHSSGHQLPRSMAPAYFDSIITHTSLAISDVLNDNRSSELSIGYLIPNNISSMLDTAIYVSGHLTGLISLEEVGQIRNWEVDEIAFAGTIAEQTAQAMANCEKLKQEKELRQLQVLLENIINSMPSAIIGVSRENKIVQWNSEAEKLTGLKTTEAIGQSLINVFTLFNDVMDKVLSAIEDKVVRKITKIPIILKEDIHYFEMIIYPLNDNQIGGVVIGIDDITEKLKIDEMMVQSEKMLSVGGLAAGMAHEINNPLAGLMQTANVIANRLWLKMDNPANLKAAEKAGIDLSSLKDFMSAREIPRMITTMNESGKRVAELVQNMLSFARKSEAFCSSHDIIGILDKTIELASTDFDLRKKYDFKKIEIRREYEESLPLISCDMGKIQQVILNILHNGLQAMNSSGTIDPMFTIRAYFEKDKKMICIEIEDNGPGMEEHVRKRIFEPFFTTKPEGVGTGLGLSVSYFIITDNHNGELAVISSPGNGTNFIIHLPIIE